MKTLMTPESTNNGWSREALKAALAENREIFAVFDKRSLSLYVIEEGTLLALVWGCASREPSLGSTYTMDAKYTAALIVGTAETIDWMDYNVKVLNF